MTSILGLSLTSANLPAIAAAGQVAVPDYDRDDLVAGIVHLGVGAFHRAHQAVAVDRLLSAGLGRDFAICGIGILPSDKRMAGVLADQDGLYTLVIKHADGSREPRVIGSIVDYVFAPDDPAAAIERMARPEVRIVSMTVTEGGYNYDQVTGEFVADDPGIRHDLANPHAPTTIFGYLVAALKLRRDRGIAPFTVMSCDNIQGNGHVTRRMLVAYARLDSAEFAAWLDSAVHFPNSMVDRITPVTTDADRAEVTGRFGVEDAWPVVAEPFFQWVLEDDFGTGRPPWEEAGVQVVSEVEPYELMKLRLLNASHQAMAYFGYLAGHRYAHEAAQDPAIASLLTRYMAEEATPTLRPVPGVDLAGYQRTLIERFSNPEVRDTLARLCAETSDRIPKWLLPVVRENLAAGRPVTLSAAVCASWARYAEGVDEQGAPVEVVDRLAGRVTAAARRYADDPIAFLRDPQLFGQLADEPAFRTPYLATLDSLHQRGSAATLAELTGLCGR
ncbi:mannitol dehydrogenase family protein [Actinoplanes sp. NPDC026619]|uniref:mannitol dehydrogenase family protein n=1 Tax=Actinoplanes sp. NPDC026619 TaxID=3155798 RepID=UPI0033D3D56F